MLVKGIYECAYGSKGDFEVHWTKIPSEGSLERSWRGDEGSMNGKIIRIIIGSEIALTCENSTSSLNFPASPPRVFALGLCPQG